MEGVLQPYSDAEAKTTPYYIGHGRHGLGRDNNSIHGLGCAFAVHGDATIRTCRSACSSQCNQKTDLMEETNGLGRDNNSIHGLGCAFAVHGDATIRTCRSACSSQCNQKTDLMEETNGLGRDNNSIHGLGCAFAVHGDATIRTCRSACSSQCNQKTDLMEKTRQHYMSTLPLTCGSLRSTRGPKVGCNIITPAGFNIIAFTGF